MLKHLQGKDFKKIVFWRAMWFADLAVCFCHSEVALSARVVQKSLSCWGHDNNMSGIHDAAYHVLRVSCTVSVITVHCVLTMHVQSMSKNQSLQPYMTEPSKMFFKTHQLADIFIACISKVLQPLLVMACTTAGAYPKRSRESLHQDDSSASFLLVM